MFVSVTRIALRSYLYLIPFAWDSLRSARDASRAHGFLGGRLMGDGRKVFWTVTAWSDEAAMRAFRNAGVHLKAMGKLPDWCAESSYAHWEQDARELPDAEESHRRLRDEGRLSRVRRPSPAQAAGRTAEPSCGVRFKKVLRPARRAAAASTLRG